MFAEFLYTSVYLKVITVTLKVNDIFLGCSFFGVIDLIIQSQDGGFFRCPRLTHTVTGSSFFGVLDLTIQSQDVLFFGVLDLPKQSQDVLFSVS